MSFAGSSSQSSASFTSLFYHPLGILPAFSYNRTMNEYVLITGASSGIGKELAYIFASHGHDLFLTARNEERLQQLKEEIEGKYHVDVLYYPLDLSVNGAPEELYQETKRQGLVITTLINNAGFGDYGLFSEADLEKITQMIDLNVRSLTQLTSYVVKDMKERRRGEILNVGSVASFFPGPYMAVYYATKAYVLSFSRALREEVRDQGITVSCLCPGPTATSFFERAGAKTATVFSGNVFLKGAKEVAQYGYDLLKEDRPYGIPGLVFTLGVKAVQLMPGELGVKTLALIQGFTRQKKEK